MPKFDGQYFSSLNPILSSSPEIKNIKILSDGNIDKLVSAENLKEFTITLEAHKKFEARSLSLYARPDTIIKNAELFAEIDGKLVSVKKFSYIGVRIPRLINKTSFIFNAPEIINFPPIKSKKFILVFKEVSNAVISEIEISSYPKIESLSQKILGKMSPKTAPPWDTYMWKPQSVADVDSAINSNTVLDISRFFDEKSSKLIWDAPQGDWIIQRSVMQTTKVKNSPAYSDASGLEVDKMNRDHVLFHFNSYIAEILKRIPASDRKSFKYSVQDSYETGGLNWTDDMAKKFKDSFGYDATKFIPVFSGRIVDSLDISDRFLWDLRRFIADKISYEYVATITKISNQNGLKSWLENYGHWGFPAEFLQYGGQSDFVSGEFWHGKNDYIENRAASSCAHTYGKKTVWSESYTAKDHHFARTPSQLKKSGDMSYINGITQVLFHVYMHQPYEDKTPGINAWFGTEFNRKNTWFFKMKPFVDYLRRNMFMLQQGLNVADIAYFIGEDVPKMTGITHPNPDGYQYDFINAEVILNSLEVKNGSFYLPHGTTYKMLVLPPQDTIRPNVLAKIKKLVQDGGLVLATKKPSSSPSLEDYPNQDIQVKKISDELFSDILNSTKYKKFGKGTIAFNMSVQEAFELIDHSPDFQCENKNILFTHKKDKDTDIYFILNQSNNEIKTDAIFRVHGKTPELWNSITGEITKLPKFENLNHKISVPLEFSPNESMFIVFRDSSLSQNLSLSENFPKPTKITHIDGTWSLEFLNKKFAPKNKVNFKSLFDWKDSNDENIKYYSGSALYTNSFSIENIKSFSKIYLDLGELYDIAHIKINGEYIGGTWTKPHRLEIKKYLKLGENNVEIEVTNTWVNRLVGDSFLNEPDRNTWLLDNNITKKTPLAKSGLLGPVILLGLRKMVN